MIEKSSEYKKHHESIPKDLFRSINIRILIHELKGPLSVLETNIKILEECGPLTDLQKKALKRSLRSSNKLKSIIQALLEVGSSQSGRFKIEKFDVIQQILEVLVDSLENAKATELECFGEVEDQLRILDTNGIRVSIMKEVHGIVMAQDKIKFSCILGNLVRNCLRFKTSRVDVLVAIKGSDLEISVCDDGPGIDLESIRKLFQHHTEKQSDCVHHKDGGHGLGFISSLILARYLGGAIIIDPSVERGARFVLNVPVNFDLMRSSMEHYEDEKDFIAFP